MKLSRWLKLRRPAVVVVSVGLVLTLAAAYTARLNYLTERAGDLERRGALVIRLLDETFGLGLAKVGALQAFLDASSAVSAVEFSRFALNQGDSPGMVSLGFARIVRPEEWQEFTAAARRARSQYVVVDLARRPLSAPPSDRDVVPVWYAHQTEVRPSILGVDLAEDPGRREAIERALSSGVPSVTRMVEILGAAAGSYVEIYTPVLRSAAGGPGVAFITIDLFGLLREATDTALVGTLVEISDVTAQTAAQPPNGPSHWSGHLQVADRTWEVVLTPEDPGVPIPLVITVLTGGAAITALVAGLVNLLAATRQRSREIADLRQATQDKDVFLASVAHELRTPLTSVVGITALLAEQWAELDRHEIEELLAATHSEAQDLADLIDDLLVAGRLQAGAIHFRPEPVDLSGEVRWVLGRTNTQVDVTVDLPDSGPIVHADPLRVRQIVRNILVNASRYTNGALRIDVAPLDDGTALRISNDGPPISPELEEVLFEPYQRGMDRPITKGSIGLGLPVSQHLAQAMGGDLVYEYADGWCTFTICLPALDPSRVEAAPART